MGHGGALSVLAPPSWPRLSWGNLGPFTEWHQADRDPRDPQACGHARGWAGVEHCPAGALGWLGQDGAPRGHSPLPCALSRHLRQRVCLLIPHSSHLLAPGQQAFPRPLPAEICFSPPSPLPPAPSWLCTLSLTSGPQAACPSVGGPRLCLEWPWAPTCSSCAPGGRGRLGRQGWARAVPLWAAHCCPSVSLLVTQHLVRRGCGEKVASFSDQSVRG